MNFMCASMKVSPLSAGCPAAVRVCRQCARPLPARRGRAVRISLPVSRGDVGQPHFVEFFIEVREEVSASAWPRALGT